MLTRVLKVLRIALAAPGKQWFNFVLKGFQGGLTSVIDSTPLSKCSLMLLGWGGCSYSLGPVFVLIGLLSQVSVRLAPADEKRQQCSNELEVRSMDLEPDNPWSRSATR